MPVGVSQTSPGGLLDRWAGLIAKVSSAIASVLLLGMFALINVEVAMRYLMGASTLVADEYAGYMFAALVFLGMNHAIHAEKLITIDLTGRWDLPFAASLVLLLLGAGMALFIRPDRPFLDDPANEGASEDKDLDCDPQIAGAVSK